jgi:hypothetical protein
MKYAIFLLALLFSLTASAQADSTKLYSYGVQIRANDLENSLPIFLSSETYEDLFQLIQAKYQNGAPSGSTLITLDSVRNDALVGWYTYLMQLQTGMSGAYSNRIRTALKAAPTSTFVISQCNSIDATWSAQQTAVGNEGRRRYGKKRN